MLEKVEVASGATKHDYRADIDGLRAVAVISVVLFHAFPMLSPGGFIGVDVFFVISGFVISTGILERLQTENFTLGGFYARRVRRIFPALITVLVACFVAGWFLLLTDEFKALNKHIAAGAAFVSNFALWGESGYFDGSAATKPLLHLWSLGIEEQFYFVWPILLLAANRAKVSPFVTALIVGIISFAINIRISASHPTIDFYFPVTRFWELLVGAAGASVRQLRSPKNVASIVGAALLIFGIMIIRQSDEFPGWLALIPTLGAISLILAGPDAVLNRLLSRRVFVAIGLISYPLYLWHWPLLSFPEIIIGNEPPAWVRAVSVVAAFFLAWLTYRFVERPIRYQMPGRIAIWRLCLGMAFAGVIGLSGFATDGFHSVRYRMIPAVDSIEPALVWPYAQMETCMKRYPYDTSAISFWFCAANKDRSPDILILGNSYANDVFPGLTHNPATKNLSILNIGACLPIPGIANEYDGMEPNHPCFGDAKVRQDEFISKLIDENPSIRLVILNAFWPDFDKSGNWIGHFGATAGTFTNPTDQGQTSLQAFLSGLENLTQRLAVKGIKIVLFLPKPEPYYDVRTCFSRPIVVAANTCIVDESAERSRQSIFREKILNFANSEPRLLIFDKYQAFCDGRICNFAPKGKPLMRDDEHLSLMGSDILAASFVNWAKSTQPGLLP